MDRSRNHSPRGYTPARTTTLVDNQFFQLGVWDARVNYRQGSIVFRVVEGVPTFFESIQEDNSGHTPEAFPTWWIVWTGGGGVVPVPIPGPQGTYGVWNNITNYVLGQMVYYNGFLYTALQPNTNTTPGTNPAIWQLLPWTIEHNFLGEWNLTHPYVAGQAVWYNGTIYMALLDNDGVFPSALTAGFWQNMLLPVTAALIPPNTFVYGGVDTFTLTETPVSPINTQVFVDSYHLIYGTEYTVVGNQLTLIPTGMGFIPNIGEIITFYYN
jgi:hypothetical protein